MTSARELVRLLTPPVLHGLARRLSPPRGGGGALEWEHIPEGWAYARAHPEARGWDVPEILEIYKRKWPRFLELVQGTGALGVAHESDLDTNEDMTAHNIVMSFAYSLALSARRADRLAMLDWGGGIGHFHVIAKSLLPAIEMDYTCKDVPLLAEHGAGLFPGQRFVSDESCFDRAYDFIHAGASFQYSEAWQDLLGKFARATRGYLYISCLPTVDKAASFVFIQRPYAYGYNTEYLAWCLNRQDLIDAARRTGLDLVRELVYGYKPFIHRAPEPCMYRGFLFRPNPPGTEVVD